MTDHVWKPKEGIKPPRAPIAYYCANLGCRQHGTARDIAVKISKQCSGTPATLIRVPGQV